MYDSSKIFERNYVNGSESDWFTLYGNIVGGLLGGLFTYFALEMTFKKEHNDNAPKIDISNQKIDFFESKDIFYRNEVPIELINIGGTIAKNIECKLTISNFDEVIEWWKVNKYKKEQKHNIEINFLDHQQGESCQLIVKSSSGKNYSLGGLHKETFSFLGSSVPIMINHESKIYFSFDNTISNWLHFMAEHLDYAKSEKEKIFSFDLEVNYEAEGYKKIQDKFHLQLSLTGIHATIGVQDHDSHLKYQYLLKVNKS